MLKDIRDLSDKNIRTIESDGKEIDPTSTLKLTELSRLQAAWAMKTDLELKNTTILLADHVVEMYHLIKSHEDKTEIKAYIDEYSALMLGLNKLGVIEIDYYQGKA